MEGKCYNCDNGYIYEKVSCPDCNGKERCYRCNGTGYIIVKHICPECHGTGYIKD